MLNVVKLQDGNTITKFALYSLFFVRALGERSDCFRTASAGLSQRVFNPGIDNGLAFTDLQSAMPSATLVPAVTPLLFRLVGA